MFGLVPPNASACINERAIGLGELENQRAQVLVFGRVVLHLVKLLMKDPDAFEDGFLV